MTSRRARFYTKKSSCPSKFEKTQSRGFWREFNQAVLPNQDAQISKSYFDFLSNLELSNR